MFARWQLFVAGALACGCVSETDVTEPETVEVLEQAFVEATTSGYLTLPASTGCISLSSGLSHGNETSPMTLNATALPGGFPTSASGQGSTGIQCKVPPTIPGKVAGEIQAALIKLVRTNPGAPDTYTFCRFAGTGARPFSSAITLRETFNTAPCGAGRYALIACLKRFTAAYGDLWGTFNATDGRFRDCNVSPNWHQTNTVTPGPRVIL